MRIGILTFHSAQNYGAVLQCYALQTYLSSIGYEVFIIDYKPKYFTSGQKWFKFRRFFRKNIIEVIHEFFLLPKRKKRHEIFSEFVANRLNLTPVETINNNPFDVIFIGSDQIWNYKITKGFDPFYWGAFQHPSKTIIASFAASMQDNWEDTVATEIKQLLKNFNFISVRESQLVDRIHELNKDIICYNVVDPTLLLSSRQWSDFAEDGKTGKSYLLLYQVTPSTKAVSIAKKIAEEKKLEIVYLSASVGNKNSSIVCDSTPEQFVGLFMNAAFVVCTSFHGTIFSLQFKKKFVTVRMGNGKDNRVASLLKALSLEHLFIDDFMANQNYAYNLSEETLGHLKQSSFDYIKMVTNV